MNQEVIDNCKEDFGLFMTVDLALKKGVNYRPLSTFHYLVAERLQNFYERLKRGESPRLILSVPPRHLKSTICSVEFPAWLLGKEPDWQVNIATKDADLSTTFGGETKDTVSSDFYRTVFPDRVIRSDTKSKSDWAFDTGGRYSISSIQAPPKGKGFNLIIIDDPYPGYVQAQSPAIQEMVWKTFKTDYEDRRSPNGTGIVIIMQRLGLQDLVASIQEREETLKEQGAVYHPYEVISFPAIAEEDEYFAEDHTVKPLSSFGSTDGLRLFRKKGEVLWEEGAPKKEILAMIGDDPVAFSAQYQQNPILSETQVYQAEMIRFYDDSDGSIDFSKAQHYTFLDPSVSKKKEADNSAVITIARLGLDIYVRECFTTKFNAKTILSEYFRQVLKYGSKHGVETVASQKLWSTLMRDYMNENSIKLRHGEENEYSVHTSKETRIRTNLDKIILNNRLFLKKHMTSLLREICDFPRGRRDDQIDCLASCVAMIETKAVSTHKKSSRVSREALSRIAGFY